MAWRGMIGLARRLAGDRSGVSAVEFALILPLMVAIYLGSMELSQAINIKRKVTLTASSVADLVARVEQMQASDMGDVMRAAAAVMTPYDAQTVRLRVSGVEIDEEGRPEVTWSCGSGMNALTAGETANVPADVVVPSTHLVVAEAVYPHRPTIGYVISGTVDLADTFYLRPRIEPIRTQPEC